MLVIDGFTIFGLNIKFYGLLIALAMLIGIIIAIKICKKRGFKSDDIYLLALYIIPLAIIGARLYFVIFSGRAFSFLEIFKIWEGGMAIYGGVIGGALGIVLFCLIHKKNFLNVADIAVIVLALGQGIGRIGCFFAGCCYGVEVTNPSAMWFPLSTQINGVWHYSTFFYESFFDFIIFAILLFLFLKKVNSKGIIASLYLIMYGVVRCVIETFRGDSLYLGPIKVSQLLSGILIVVGIILFVIIYTNSKKKVVNENKHLDKNS